MLKENRRFIPFIITILILTILEFLTVFLKSHLQLNQELEGTLGLAHFLHNNMTYLRVILLVGITWMAYSHLSKFKLWQKMVSGVFILLYIGIFYLANYVAQVEIYFKDPVVVESKTIDENVVPLETIILGTEINGESKAYPIDYLAFHHKVSDSIGGEPVLITYCLVCRSGRAFSPVIDGELESFRLVGMVDYNAVIQDKSSSSWWQQATGEAIVGKRKGAKMEEYYSEQMVLSSWMDQYPNSLIFQPDSTFAESYEDFEGFATGYGAVNDRADSSWSRKSWVVGVVYNESALAFDYAELAEKRVMNDILEGIPVVVALEQDTVSFHAWDSRIDTMDLVFQYDSISSCLVDTQTQSSWNMNGVCMDGELEGQKLKTIQAYVEYWHSWKDFHPEGRRSGFEE